MEYAILNEDGTYKTKVTTTGKLQWDENTFCSAEALFTDGKAEQFNVVEFYETEPPIIDPMVEEVLFDGGKYSPILRSTSLTLPQKKNANR